MQPLSNTTHWENNKASLEKIPLQQLIAMAQADWYTMAGWLRDRVAIIITRKVYPLLKAMAQGGSTARQRRLQPDATNPDDIDDIAQSAMEVMSKAFGDPGSPIGVALGTDYLRALVSCVVTGCYHHVTKQHGIKSEKVEETWPDRLTGEPRTTGRRLRTAPLVVMDPGDIENALSARHTPASDIEFMADLNAAEARIRDPKHREAVGYLFGGKKLEESVASKGVGPRTLVARFNNSAVGEMLADRLAVGDGEEHRGRAREELRERTGKGDVRQVAASVPPARGESVNAPSEDVE